MNKTELVNAIAKNEGIEKKAAEKKTTEKKADKKTTKKSIEATAHRYSVTSSSCLTVVMEASLNTRLRQMPI